MRWTCCTAAGSTVSVSSPRTATSRAWRRVSASRAPMSMGSGSRRRPRASGRRAADSFTPRTCCLRPRYRLPKRGPPPRLSGPRPRPIPVLTKAVAQLEAEDGWVGLAAVGQRLANIASDFDPRTYGYRKLSDLVRQTGAFDIDQPDGKALRVRIRPTQPPRIRGEGTAAATRKRPQSA
ncbi:OST-HTH/LOTUS domain-containing protein [Mycobacterium sp. KBS0706]|uniref:OST-HTH/LOTUS domain-containing protein n=1 Tax=Mycobacterium sp. KBS0706 TaxID=2578109 RepID=UPI00359F55C0